MFRSGDNPNVTTASRAHLNALTSESRMSRATDSRVIASRISVARRFTHDTPAMPVTAPATNQNTRLNINVTVVPEIPVTNGPE